MSSIQVSGLIGSIIIAFANGLEIWKRMKARKSSGRSQPKRHELTSLALKIQKSLQHRPEQILAEYRKSYVFFGDRFAVGDGEAQNSLNSTLLSLNTGLIHVMSQSMSSRPADTISSRTSLLSLIEAAATESLQALGQLRARLYLACKEKPSSTGESLVKLAHHTSPKALSAPKNKSRTKSTQRIQARERAHRQKSSPTFLPSRVWVRPREGSSTARSSSSGISSISKAARHKKFSPLRHRLAAVDGQKKSTNNITQPSRLSASVGAHDKFGSTTSQSSPQRRSSPLVFPSEDRSQPRADAPNRQPSMLIVSPEALTDIQAAALASQGSPGQSFHRYSHSATWKASELPSMPAVPSSKVNIKMRYRPPSSATVKTFTTTSTKIGEIPPSRCLTKAEQLPQSERDRLLSQNTDTMCTSGQSAIPQIQQKNHRWAMMKFWKKNNPARIKD